MSYKTHKIAAQIRSFNNGDDAMNLTNTFNALRHRTLGYKHFEQAKTHIVNMMRAAGEAMVAGHFLDSQTNSPLQKLQNRRMNFSLTYMSVNIADEDTLRAASMRGLIEHDRALLFTRDLPLQLSAQHLEFRHIQRTCEPLAYRSDDFKYAVAFSLALSAVLGKIMTPDSAPVPCLIPHSAGVFLGVASYTGTPCSETYGAFRSYHQKGPYVGALSGNLYGSPVTIELKTSLGRREISRRQAELREQLLLPGFPNGEAIVARGMDIHSLCVMHDIIPKPEKDAWHALCHRLETVIDTPLWREEGKKALQNLKKHEYN